MACSGGGVEGATESTTPLLHRSLGQRDEEATSRKVADGGTDLGVAAVCKDGGRRGHGVPRGLFQWPTMAGAARSGATSVPRPMGSFVIHGKG